MSEVTTVLVELVKQTPWAVALLIMVFGFLRHMNSMEDRRAKETEVRDKENRERMERREKEHEAALGTIEKGYQEFLSRLEKEKQEFISRIEKEHQDFVHKIAQRMESATVGYQQTQDRFVQVVEKNTEAFWYLHALSERMEDLLDSTPTLKTGDQGGTRPPNPGPVPVRQRKRPGPGPPQGPGPGGATT